MDAFELSRLLTEGERAQSSSFEFLRVPSLSLGVYRLPAGGTDSQQPHSEDEVYYVLKGRGSFRAGDEERQVRAGMVLYVKAGDEHRFHSIEEDLVLLVFFAPAQGSLATTKKSGG